MVIGIAMGRETIEQLEWFVQSNIAHFEALEANTDDVGTYFVNGFIEKKGGVDADDDLQMSVNDEAAQTASPMDIDPPAQHPESAAPAGLTSPLITAPTEGLEGDLLMHNDDIQALSRIYRDRSCIP